MPVKLLIASKNPAKIKRLKELLQDLPVNIVTLSELKLKEVEEKGKTFKENAIKKADVYCQQSGLITIADDAGLEIDALGGAPGVKSRRWLGYKMADEEMIQEVLKRMKKVPKNKRTAKLKAAIAVAIPGQAVKVFEGTVKGEIAQKPVAERIKGFPFRSIFYFPQFRKFYCQLTSKEYELVNQRRKPVEKIKKIILKEIC